VGFKTTCCFRFSVHNSYTKFGVKYSILMLSFYNRHLENFTDELWRVGDSFGVSPDGFPQMQLLDQ
jgi:hypothetical protein